MKSKITFKNICAYLQGNLRYFCYYGKFRFLIRTHILEQIGARITSMDKACYNTGQCQLCGCATTALQMANKACDKPCYPKMLSKKQWKNMSKKGFLHWEDTRLWCYNKKSNKFILLNN